MPLTVNDIRRFFETEIRAEGRRQPDCVVQFAGNLADTPRVRRTALIHQFGTWKFISQWFERIERKIEAGHYRELQRGNEFVLSHQGVGWIEQFAEGDSEILGALIAYQAARRDQRYAEAGLDRFTPAQHRTWCRHFSNFYTIGDGRNRTIPVGRVQVPTAPLARWLLSRWQTMAHLKHELSVALQIAGWYPSRNMHDQDYVGSFNVLSEGAARADRVAQGEEAGNRYFARLLGEYGDNIYNLGDQFIRHFHPGSYGGATGAIEPLGAEEREVFIRRLRAWGRINQSPGRISGLPPNGLPYGPSRRAGQHKERVRWMYVRVMTPPRSRRAQRAAETAAGVQLPGACFGGGPPYMADWF